MKNEDDKKKIEKNAKIILRWEMKKARNPWEKEGNVDRKYNYEFSFAAEEEQDANDFGEFLKKNKEVETIISENSDGTFILKGIIRNTELLSKSQYFELLGLGVRQISLLI